MNDESSAHSGTSNVSAMSSLWSTHFSTNSSRLKSSRALFFSAQYTSLKGRTNSFYQTVFVLTMLSQLQLLVFTTRPAVNAWSAPFDRLQKALQLLSVSDIALDSQYALWSVNDIVLSAAAIVIIVASLGVPALIISYGRSSYNNQEPHQLVRFVARLVAPVFYTIGTVPILDASLTVLADFAQLSGANFLKIAGAAVLAPVVVAHVLCAALYLSTIIHVSYARPLPITAAHNRCVASAVLLFGVVWASSAVCTTLSITPKVPLVLASVLAGLLALQVIIRQPYLRLSSNVLLTTLYSTIAVTGAATVAAHHASDDPRWGGGVFIVAVVLVPLPNLLLVGVKAACYFLMMKLYDALHGYETSVLGSAAIAPAPDVRAPRFLLACMAVHALRLPVQLIRRRDGRLARGRLNDPVELPGYSGTPQFGFLTQRHAADGSGQDGAREVLVRVLFRCYQLFLPLHPGSGELLMGYLSAIMCYRPINISDGLARAEEQMTRRILPDRAFFYYMAFKSKMDLLSGDPDQAERVERSRRLHTLNKSQRALYDYRRRFWETVQTCRGRALTAKGVAAILSLAEKESKELTHIQNAYRPLLAKATPNVIRDYAVFIKDALGMQAECKAYLAQADDLESSGRHATQAVPLVQTKAASGGLAFHSRMEVELAGVSVALVANTVLALGAIFVVFRYLFFPLMWLFYSVAAINIGLYSEVVGAYDFKMTGDPRALIGQIPTTHQLLTAALNTAPVDYIQAGLGEWVTGWPMAAKSATVNTSAAVAEWSSAWRISRDVDWDLGVLSGDYWMGQAVDLVSGHLGRLDTEQVEMVSAGVPYNTTGGQAVMTQVATLAGIATEALYGLVTNGSTTGLHGAPRLTDPAHAALAGRLDGVLDSAAGVEAVIAGAFADVFRGIQVFPVVIVDLCAVMLIITCGVISTLNVASFLRPLIMHHALQLETIRLFLMLPDKSAKRTAVKAAANPTGVPPPPPPPPGMPPLVATSPLTHTDRPPARPAVIPALGLQWINSGTIPTVASLHDDDSVQADLTSIASSGTGPDGFGLSPRMTVDPPSSTGSVVSDLGDPDAAIITVDDSRLDDSGSSSSEGSGDIIGRDMSSRTAHKLLAPRAPSAGLGRRGPGQSSDTDLIDAETLMRAVDPPPPPPAPGADVVETDDPGLFTSASHTKLMAMVNDKDALRTALERENTTPALTRWSMVKRRLIARHIARNAGLLALMSGLTIAVLATGMTFITYRVLTDIRTGTSAFIAYQGILRSSSIAAKASAVAEFEARTGTNATEHRDTIVQESTELSAVLSWMTSSSVDASYSWLPAGLGVQYEALKALQKLVLSPSWTSGIHQAELQDVLTSRQCANTFIAGHCSEAFGGHLASVAAELDGGALEATSHYIGLARALAAMPVADPALPAAMAELTAANIDHVIPYLLKIQTSLRLRLISSVDTTGMYIMLLMGVCFVLGVTMFFTVYRRTAERLRHSRQQLMTVLDVVVRVNGRSFTPLMMYLVHSIRPEHFDDTEMIG